MDIVLGISKSDLRLSLDLLLSEEPGVNIVGTASETAGLKALLETTRPQIVLADWNLPNGTIADLLAELCAREKHPAFIVMSGSRTALAAAFTAGADACVLKGESPRHLMAAFRQIRKEAERF